MKFSFVSCATVGNQVDGFLNEFGNGNGNPYCEHQKNDSAGIPPAVLMRVFQ